MTDQSKPNWCEETYLQANPDIRAAVEQGVVPDGYYHWVMFGQFEQRSGSTLPRSETGQTRQCLDPWVNAEFQTNGSVRACCIFPGMEDLKEWDSLAQLRESPSFCELRHGLLSGDLHERCRKCHIREMGPIQKQVRSVFDAVGAGVPLLHAAALKTARVDINEECNLRCVYCAVSQPNYKGVPMQDDLMDKLSLLLGDLTDLQALDVNGHGETTHHPRWKEFCRPLLDKGIPLTIITNLGRKYTAEDYEVLSRFKVIQISLDTADETLLRDVRRKVDVSRIIYNMAMIRTHALLADRTPPTMSFSCGVYDLSAVRLEEFAWFAVTQGISSVTFWNLVKYPDVPGAITVRALESLPDAELAEAVACFDRAMAILDHFQIETEIAGGFIEKFRTQLEQKALAESTA